MQSALEAATKSDMKEIKGLEERLFGLEQLMFESKRIVQEQSDLATVSKISFLFEILFAGSSLA